MSHNQLVLRLFISIGVVYAGNLLFNFLERYPPLHSIKGSILYGLTKVVIAAGVFVVILILPYLRSEQARSTQFQAAAAKLGLPYHDGAFEPSPSLLRSPLLRRGYRHSFGPAMSGTYENTQIESFYFSYIMKRSSDTDDRCFRTTVVLSSRERHVPDFVMAERGIGDRIARGLFKSKSGDFPDDPEFSRRYSVKGEDREALERFFGPELRSVLIHSKRTWALSGIDNRLIIYADGGFDEEIKSKDFIPYFEETRKIFEASGK